MVLLDKLTATPYSETYRAYDLENQTFVAQKNIHLESPTSWNQANLILRQQQQQQLYPFLAQTLSIDYDEKKQNMKVMNELQNTILKDYSFHMKDHQNLGLKERMKLYTLQIIQQLNTLKQMGVELEGKTIDTRKIFIEKTSQRLKLYDFSDFVIKDGKSEIDQKELLEIAKETLLSLNTESINMAELSLIFKEIETEMQLNGRSAQDNSEKISGYTSESYDQFIFDKLLRVLKEKESSKRNSQNEGKDGDLLSDLRMVYKKHAEVHKSKGDFKSALECYEKIMEIEENLDQAKEGIKSEMTKINRNLDATNMTEQESYVPTSFSGKLAVFTMKAIVMVSSFIIGFLFFGLLFAVCFYRVPLIQYRN